MLGSGPPPPVRPREAGPAPSARPDAVPSGSRRGHIPGEVGIWVFIFGDMLVFALFFGVFMVERGENLRAFHAGRESLDTALGAINTLLLLTGSILVVLAMSAVRKGFTAGASRLLLGAMGTGALFVVDKAIEYTDKIHAGLTPHSGDFYTLFFVFTGIHLMHLLIGLGALGYMLTLARRRTAGAHDLATMESCASYWHLVDLLWLVLFPLFYLVA